MSQAPPSRRTGSSQRVGDPRKHRHPRGPHLGARGFCALCPAAPHPWEPNPKLQFPWLRGQVFPNTEGVSWGKKKSKPSFEIKFPVYLQYIRAEIQRGNSIGNGLFSCAPVNPWPPRPPHQSGEDLNTAIMTDCIGHIFFFKMKVLFQREAQRRHCREQAGASRGLEDLPDGNKRRWLLIKGSHWWALVLPHLRALGSHCRGAWAPDLVFPSQPPYFC